MPRQQACCSHSNAVVNMHVYGCLDVESHFNAGSCLLAAALLLHLVYWQNGCSRRICMHRDWLIIVQ